MIRQFARWYETAHEVRSEYSKQRWSAPRAGSVFTFEEQAKCIHLNLPYDRLAIFDVDDSCV